MPKYESPFSWDRFFTNFKDLTNFTYGHVAPKHKKEPREIKHVIWDADDTLWDIEPFGLAGAFDPPYKKIDANTLEGSDSFFSWKDIKEKPTREISPIKREKPLTLHLKPGLLETLDTLREKGIGSSIASSNPPGVLEPILDALNIRDKFDIVKSEHTPKSTIVRDILDKTGILGNQVMFVDDSPSNVDEVAYLSGALGVTMGWDIVSPKEILALIKESGELKEP